MNPIQEPVQPLQLPAPLPAGAPLEAQLGRAKELSELLANLQGERNVYQRQVRGPESGIRTNAQQQVAQLDIQITRVSTALRSVRQDIMSRVPQNVVTSTGQYVPAGRNRDSGGFNGDQVTGIIIVFTLAVLMPIALGITRRLWRRGAPVAAAPGQDVVVPRLDRMEQAVDAIAIEIERISEGQRFVTKVMTERPTVSRPPSTPDVNEPGALGEAKPFLALGAGPMEPIPVAQRQAVRQSITPH